MIKLSDHLYKEAVHIYHLSHECFHKTLSQLSQFLLKRELSEVKTQYEKAQEEEQESQKDMVHLKEMLMEREVSEPVCSFIIVCVTLILLASPYSQSS